MGERTAPAVESVDRAIRMLEVLGRHGSGASLDELATSLSLPKSSLHRTLAALRERGFATQREDGRYLLGPELLRIAFDFYGRLDVRVLLRPTLERLRSALNETIHLGVLDGADVVYVDKLEPTQPIALSSKVGGRDQVRRLREGHGGVRVRRPMRRRTGVLRRGRPGRGHLDLRTEGAPPRGPDARGRPLPAPRDRCHTECSSSCRLRVVHAG
jgi:DNA-binding transcriptional ArsR family regulator